MTEWTWVIIGIIAVLLVGGGLLWGAYMVARQQRGGRSQGRLDYQPPPPPPLPPPAEPAIRWGDMSQYDASPLPPSTVQPLPSPAGPSIRWGDTAGYDETPSTFPGPDSVQWGEEREWTEVSPDDGITDSDGESIMCPLCRQEMDKATEQIIECPQCETLYHQHCLADMDNKCSVCGREGL